MTAERINLQPRATPSVNVPRRPSEQHIWDNGSWRQITATEAVYLLGAPIK